MMNLIQKAEEILIELNDKKGFLTEDEIIDVCIELDLDLVEIDVMCERLLNKKMLFSDNITSVNDSVSDGRLWEVLTARYFSAICLPDCTVMQVTA